MVRNCILRPKPWGKCCVAGAGSVHIDAAKRRFTVDGRTFGPKDVISIDGNTGEVFKEALKPEQPSSRGACGAAAEGAAPAPRVRGTLAHQPPDSDLPPP